MPRIGILALAPVLVFTCTSGCGSSGADGGAQPGDDAAVDSAVSIDALPHEDAGDAATTKDAVSDGDGGVIDDGAPVEIRCSAGDGPYLVVTRPSTGAGASTSLLRVPIWTSRGVHELKLTSVSQRTQPSGSDPGKELRAWDVTKLVGPAGFDGTATPKVGWTTAEVTFTAVQDALDADTAQCASSIEKRTGSLHVEGSTREGGAFVVDCPFAYGGVGPMPGALPVACAKGVAGWLGSASSTGGGLSSITTPVSAALADSAFTVHDTTTAPVTGIVATDFTVKAMRITTPFVTCAGAPGDWSPSGGTHQLWRGSSSTETWNGPVAAGAEESASWLWQLVPGSVPDGFVNTPSTGGDPTKECPPVNARVVLRGTSSAGAWEWEGGWFVAYRTK